MKTTGPAALAATLALTSLVGAQPPARLPAEMLLDTDALKALDEELSGVAAKGHVARLAELHRVPASPGFHEAIVYVSDRAKAFGLSDVHVETFPGDGTTYFGTLHGNRGWRLEAGTLDEVAPRARRIISTDDVRLAVADNSETADVTADLVDVGSGAQPRDYDGRDVRGKLVLCDAVPSACHRRAVEERGAVGLVSYNSNQVSAWWRDNPDLIRWGHLDARGRRNTFAIMIALGEARSLQMRLARGERITLHASVRARNDDTLPYETLVATIPGADPAAGDVVFSCHLDHEKPGANDNASGCAANLEVARTLRALIDARRIPPPVRTIRFVWPSEMTGTIAYLAKYPDIASRLRAVVHLDMVGADPFLTKSVLHVTRSPWSIATVTDDVGEIFGRYVIEGAFRAAADGDMTRAIRSPSGSKDALWADITPYESGSDHWIYQEGGFGIPAIYLRDHPDIYIHTTGDLPDNIEPTKIKRSAFIAATSGYYLATMPDRGESLVALSYANAHERLAADGRRAIAMAADNTRRRDAANIVGQAVLREQRRLRSISRFAPMGALKPDTPGGGPGTIPSDRTNVGSARAADTTNAAALERLGGALAEAGKAILLTFMTPDEANQLARAGFRLGSADARVPVRQSSVKGPLTPDGDWLHDKAGAAAGSIAIARVPNSGDVTYEIVNFIDGARTVGDIRDAVSAEFEPIDLAAVSEYIDVLVKAGAVSFKPR
jgi:aminopeptidase YwaD